MDNALAKVKQAFSDMWVKIQPIIEQIKQAFMKLLNALGTDCRKYTGHVVVGFCETVLEPLTHALEYLHNPVPNVRKDFLYINAESLKKSHYEIHPRLDDIFGKPIIEQIKQAFMKLLNALQPVFEFILTYIGSIVNGIISAR